MSLWTSLLCTSDAASTVHEIPPTGDAAPALPWDFLLPYLQKWQVKVVAALVVLYIALRIVRRIGLAIRRRRPASLNPKLQRFQDAGGVFEAIDAKRRLEAARIVATSSTSMIAGYQIKRQVEAVFVEGFRRPEEALEGLKAVAAMKGANAVTNVRTERNSTGRCCASGDAVVVEAAAGQPALDRSSVDSSPVDGTGAEKRGSNS